MSRVTEAEFIALTGCSLTSPIITYILDAADTDVDNYLASKLASVTADVAHQAALCYAKAILADRNRFDGTFDVSTLEYSHKGNTDSIISGLRSQAEALLSIGISKGAWISRVDA